MDLVKEFDFSSLLPKDKALSACTTIDKWVERGDYWDENIQYQTKGNILFDPNPVFTVLRYSFIAACNLWLEDDFELGLIQSWAVKTNKEKYNNIDAEKLWHHHNYPNLGAPNPSIPNKPQDVNGCRIMRGNIKSHNNEIREINNERPVILSGLFYLHVPDDNDNIDLCGTEFAPNGLDSKERFNIKPEYGKWFIYPGYYWHRTMPQQSMNWRYVIAADAEIDPEINLRLRMEKND